jgi:CheY-like chemotaxis protein
MKKRVLSVGQCGPDTAAIRSFLTRNFDCEMKSADAADDAMAQLHREKYDLVLVNRKLDCDYSDGIEVIRALKADPVTAGVAVMLVTNYPEHQDAAIAAGALRGFGKLEFGKRETVELLAPVLGEA